MSRNPLIQPFLKWAGGKRQLLEEIRKYIPSTYNTYYEPFVGGGAVLFNLQPKTAIINDINPELINTYQVIQSQIDELVYSLTKHINEKNYFYTLRELDRKPEFNELSAVERASRLIYLNKTCFNGLFRVNRQGHFNVPFGHYENPNIINEKSLRFCHDYLASNHVEILNVDFAHSVSNAKKGDFVYFDPPYDPISDTSSFTGYSLNGFGKKEQIRLKEIVDALTSRRCKVMVSNSATKFMKELYKDYTITIVEAKRAINSNASKRGKIDEILVTNYEIT